MKKKLLYGAAVLLLFLCMPFTRLDLATGTLRSAPTIIPDLPETPVVTDGQYSMTLESSIGILTYYNQSDSRWSGFLYGGRDPMRSYGCGPTALAMVVSSFTEYTLSPSDMAAWAAEHGYWSSGHGTSHSFIPEGAAAFGLKAESFKNFTEEGVLSELSSGHILIALMGPGHFTANGHFIIIADNWSENQVRIADPVNLDNTLKAWDIQLILDELNSTSNSGGPVWSISPR